MSLALLKGWEEFRRSLLSFTVDSSTHDVRQACDIIHYEIYTASDDIVIDLVTEHLVGIDTTIDTFREIGRDYLINDCKWSPADAEKVDFHIQSAPLDYCAKVLQASLQNDVPKEERLRTYILDNVDISVTPNLGFVPDWVYAYISQQDDSFFKLLTIESFMGVYWVRDRILSDLSSYLKNDCGLPYTLESLEVKVPLFELTGLALS